MLQCFNFKRWSSLFAIEIRVKSLKIMLVLNRSEGRQNHSGRTHVNRLIEKQ